MSPIWIIFVPLAILASYLAYEYWPRSQQQLFDKRFRELRDNMKSRNLTDDQVKDEFDFRMAMARLRRLATEAAIARPADTRDRIRSLAIQESKLIRSRSTQRKFIEIATSGPIEDILYPKGMKALDRYDKKMVDAIRPGVTEDQIAAVTTLTR